MTRLILDTTAPTAPVSATLDADQAKVVAHRKGALRVLAGPGTGKTTTLVEAMVDRLTGENPLKPEQVLGLTFGRRAALDWRDRVTAQIGGGVIPTISTFHSFCYALVRQFQSTEDYLAPFRLLSGPEQESRSRQLFNDSISDGQLNWPAELMPAVGTRGLAEEVRAVMSRTRSHLMEPTDLVALGDQAQNPSWSAIGEFMEEYLNVLDAEGVIDYSELIYRAVLLSHQPHVQEFLHSHYKAIFVDEYQDTDPGQVALLKAMVSPETSLVVVGDVDQAIYGFRGADEAGIRKFKAEFSPLFNNDFADVVLKNCRRFGSNIRTVATEIIGDRIPSGFRPEDIKAHRTPSVDKTVQDEVLVRTFDSEGAEAAHIADLVARAHAHQGFAWSDIAVIVRSARVSLPAIQRALVSSGVPVNVAADEVPIHLDPAVTPLLDVLKVIDNPRALTPELAHDILAGPLAGVDQIDLRRLAAQLRKLARANGEPVLQSGQLIANAMAKPGLLVDVAGAEHAGVIDDISTIGKLIEDARSQISKGVTPHDVLNFVWQSSGWSKQLEQRALSFEYGAHNANRDLDSICALFDLANRFVSRGGSKDLTIFLAEIQSQAIPAEPLAENDTRSDSVRLLTAHRAKGLQWPLVIVAGIQEELWPDIRTRQTILQSDRIGPNEVLFPPTYAETLASERRLFYVAATRAMQKLILTAVDTGMKEDGLKPSRFLTDLKEKITDLDWQHYSGRPKRPLTIDGLIANLRQVLNDEKSSNQLRQAAAYRLAQLGANKSHMFRNALPENWWGINEITKNAKPETIALSATAIDGVEGCSLKWFLEKRAGAVSDAGIPMVFGNIMHLIAEGLQNKEIALDVDLVDQKIDQIWDEINYEAAWEAKRERLEAHDASVRLVNWFAEHQNIEAVAEAQVGMNLSVTDDDGVEYAVQISGYADRIEFAVDGVKIYDYKTSKKVVAKKELASNVQLALYTYLLQNGFYKTGDQKQQLDPGTEIDSAALIQLRNGSPEFPEIQELKAGQHDENSDVKLSDRIKNAALVIAQEKFETKYDHNSCSYCPVRTLCPAMPEGRQVQL